MNSQDIVFQGETQLLRWAETSQGGATITLALSDAADLERFKLMTLKKKGVAGQRLMTVMVEIGDDEQPVDQNGSSAPEKPKGGALAKLAGIFCNAPEFWAFCNAHFSGQTFDADGAAKLVRFMCDIKSRAELDSNGAAAEAFHATFRLPYLDWKQGRST